MALENNAICDICGKPYHVCQSCQDIVSFKPWRTVTDTFPHYMIFLAISEYTRVKDKEKAKEALSKCNLTDLENFNEDIKKVIHEIIDESVVEKKKQSTSTKRKTSIKTPIKTDEVSE